VGSPQVVTGNVVVVVLGDPPLQPYPHIMQALAQQLPLVAQSELQEQLPVFV
jgi:hypothetical protein